MFSEIAAATLIAVCGLKRSYRIILRGEQVVRRQLYVISNSHAPIEEGRFTHSPTRTCSKKPSPIVEGYDTFPRFFVRRVFRAGLAIAMRWEGRAKTGMSSPPDTRCPITHPSTIAAQRAADARMRARRAGKLVVSRAEDMRCQARERATAVRERVSDVAERATAVGERVSREYAKRASTRAEKEASRRERDSDATESLSTRTSRGIAPPAGDRDSGTMKMVRTRFR